MTINQRTILFAEYIVEHGATVRDTADHFGYGKSTVHSNVTKTLKKLDFPMFRQVRAILDNHYATRHLKGGESTKQKYLEKKKDD